MGLRSLPTLLLQTVALALRPRVLNIGANLTLTDGPLSGEATLAATGSATIAASAITSGTIATARLGSGVADNTTFLRGDQSYAVPAGGGGSAFCGASVYNNGSDQTLPATTNTLLVWSTASGAVTAYDTDTLFDVMDPTKLTVPAGKTGKWQVGGSVELYGSAPGSGNRKVDIKINGTNNITPFLFKAVDAQADECYTFSAVFNLTAGDYVELNAYNAAAVDLLLSNGASSSIFQMTYLGA